MEPTTLTSVAVQLQSGSEPAKTGAIRSETGEPATACDVEWTEIYAVGGDNEHVHIS